MDIFDLENLNNEILIACDKIYEKNLNVKFSERGKKVFLEISTADHSPIGELRCDTAHGFNEWSTMGGFLPEEYNSFEFALTALLKEEVVAA
jgi:hypothetical protein